MLLVLALGLGFLTADLCLAMWYGVPALGVTPVSYTHLSQLVGRLDYLERYKYPTRYAARQSEEWKALDAERTKLREALAALDVNTPVSMDAPGMQMMTGAIEMREKALAGTEGVPRFLGETAISIGQNLALMPKMCIRDRNDAPGTKIERIASLPQYKLYPCFP